MVVVPRMLPAVLAACVGAASVSGQVTTLKTPEAELVNRWFAEGTAAGNEGDLYDNRDRGHSELGIANYPQLERVSYTAEERAANANWALPRVVREGPVIANASLSASAAEGGSLARQAYMTPQYRGLLPKLYRGGTLFVCPEHRDHDPGENGVGGYGDLYPANTPYLIISQGSSGSDRAFINAFTLTLAAFRPEVKRRLQRSGLLGPTVQMIFRMSNRNLAGPEDYLTGLAHPTVFEGRNVDALKMVKMAQGMTLDRLPPFVELEVLDPADGPGEKVWDSHSAVVRVHRGLARDLVMTVSAELSESPTGEELKFHWVVLRGDAERIEIAPRDGGKVAEITVPWHPRRPLGPESPLRTNRVDIGVIAQNAHYYSAPAFISVVSLPNEMRAYDEEGRLLDVGYDAGSTAMITSGGAMGADHPVSDKVALFDALESGVKGLGGRLLQKELKPAELAFLRRTGREFRLAAARATRERQRIKPLLDEAEVAWKAAQQVRSARARALKEARAADATNSTPETKEAVAVALDAEKAAAADYGAKSVARNALRTELAGLSKPLADLLERRDPSLGASADQVTRRALASLRDTPDLYPTHANLIDLQPGADDAEFKGALARASRLGFSIGTNPVR